MKTSLTKEEKLYIKKCKDSVIYSEDGTRLLKVRTTSEYFEVRSGTQVICDDAFMGNTSIHEVVIPECVVAIGKHAFENCTSLFKVNIPEHIEMIMPHCFEGCGHLTIISLPSALEQIMDSAFQNCSSLQTLSFPKGLKVIDKFSFQNSGIKEVVIDTDVTCGIYERAFCGCTNLERVTLGKNVKIRAGEEHPAFTFANCTTLKEFEVKKVSTIGTEETSKSMFHGCSALERIVLPYSNYPRNPDFNSDPDEYVQYPPLHL